MFPYIMITCSIIFFEQVRDFMEFFLHLKKFLKKKKLKDFKNPKTIQALFFSIQLLFPFRYFLYKLFWKEQGYRLIC